MKTFLDVERANELVRVGAISERRSCISKVSYPNRNDAKHAAKAVANKTGRETDTYSCVFCRGWHVTKAKHGQEISNTSEYAVTERVIRRRQS